jgi:hypothetical protein
MCMILERELSRNGDTIFVQVWQEALKVYRVKREHGPWPANEPEPEVPEQFPTEAAALSGADDYIQGLRRQGWHLQSAA